MYSMDYLYVSSRKGKGREGPRSGKSQMGKVRKTKKNMIVLFDCQITTYVTERLYSSGQSKYVTTSRCKISYCTKSKRSESRKHEKVNALVT